jgi:hypothetical protein
MINKNLIKIMLILIFVFNLYYTVDSLSNFIEFSELYFYSFSAFMYLNLQLLISVHTVIISYLTKKIFYNLSIDYISFKKVILYFMILEIIFLFLTDLAFIDFASNWNLAYPFYIQRIVLYAFYYLISSTRYKQISINQNSKVVFYVVPVLYILSQFIYGINNLGFDEIAHLRDVVLVLSVYYLNLNSQTTLLYTNQNEIEYQKSELEKELDELESLYKKGILSEKEYLIKRRIILNR